MITKGSKYVFEFDAMASENRHFEIRIQQNGGNYENYLLEGASGHLVDTLGTEMKHYKFEFTSAVTDAAPRVAINLGYFDGDKQYDKYEMVKDPETGIIDFVSNQFITLDNFVLKCTYDSGEVIDMLDLDSRPKATLNQVGFYPAQQKQVVFRGDMSSLDGRFSIVNVDTGEKEDFNGFVTTFGTNPTSLEYVGYGDFSSFTKEGTFKIVGNKGSESPVFTISNSVYDNINNDLIMMLYRQRCGEVLGETDDPFAHTACHQELATIYGETTTIDVSGGWHDAGDYGKYVVAGAQTVADLLLTYDRIADSADEIFHYPSYVTGTDSAIPDILEEAMYELDWMLKMQRADGQVYHKVSTKEFPTNNVKPQDDHGQLYVSPVSYAATADFAAVMAMAARTLQSIAPYKATEYSAAASKAYNALSSMTKTSFTNPSDIKTGEYPDSDLDDELSWAAIEMYAISMDTTYLDTFLSNYTKTDELGLGWANVNGFAVVTALQTINPSDERFVTIANKVIEFADELVEISKTDVYNITIKSFEWGSNLSIASNGMVLDFAASLIDYAAEKLGLTDEQASAKYAEYIKVREQQLNYLLGQNACAYCFVTGYGTLTPQHPHHRPSIAANAAMPGMLVGGPDSNFEENGEDQIAKRYCAGHAAAHCWVDNDNSWSTNEITIYWNSPLIFLITAVTYDNIPLLP